MHDASPRNDSLPAYVLALQAAYGPPSQEGFGSAVFFEEVDSGEDLQDLARHYYQYFVGDLWERWGGETWLSPWKEVYRRETSADHDIIRELNAINDRDAAMFVPMILDAVDDAAAAREALSQAFDPAAAEELRIFRIGDGEAYSGLLLAGRRTNGAATFLLFLLD
ncbi:MAG: hypothetical protein R3293_25205 [Candidatus Promineifilaceae bacterium]|nr:hypothetical protein [Candidatus Promineifilaceae bacterium]